MIAILCKNYVRAENRSAFLEVAARHAELSKADKGCLQFSVYVSDNSDEIVFSELWENEQWLAVHSERCITCAEVPLLSSLRYDKTLTKYTVL